MSLKMKVGSFYYNKLAGVLQCHNYVSGVCYGKQKLPV